MDSMLLTNNASLRHQTIDRLIAQADSARAQLVPDLAINAPDAYADRLNELNYIYRTLEGYGLDPAAIFGPAR